MTILLALAAASLLAWLYLTFAHGAFWRCDQRLGDVPAPASWPAVTAVVPARDEAGVIAASVGALLDQDYPGTFRAVLADDASGDVTAARAREAAARHPRGERLEVVATPPRPAGWVGKMWAVSTGVGRARELAPDTRYLWLTDADVVHPPETLRRLVAHAETDGLDLCSQMVLLDRRGGWERLLIPAFVYFFQQLYPFCRVNDLHSRVAAAAGGSMLVRASALEDAGGVARIRGEVIDDCALARLLKRRGGAISLTLAEDSRSIRAYGGLAGVWDMVARTAYVQLRHSPWLLAATVLGLLLLYATPPLVALAWPLHDDAPAALVALAAWGLMSLTFVPVLRLYRQPLILAPALPVAGVVYLVMTLDSARRHRRGQGARWKGRPGAGA